MIEPAPSSHGHLAPVHQQPGLKRPLAQPPSRKPSDRNAHIPQEQLKPEDPCTFPPGLLDALDECALLNPTIARSYEVVLDMTWDDGDLNRDIIAQHTDLRSANVDVVARFLFQGLYEAGAEKSEPPVYKVMEWEGCGMLSCGIDTFGPVGGAGGYYTLYIRRVGHTDNDICWYWKRIIPEIYSMSNTS